MNKLLYRFDGKWTQQIYEEDVELAILFLKDGVDRIEIMRQLRKSGRSVSESTCAVAVAEGTGQFVSKL